MFVLLPSENLRACGDLNEKVMRRVRLVYLSRKIMNPFVGESIVLVVLGTGVFKLVSVSSVLSNSPSITQLRELGGFWISAWESTQFPIQAITAAIAIIGAALCVHSVKIYRSARQTRLICAKFNPILAERG